MGKRGGSLVGKRGRDRGGIMGKNGKKWEGLRVGKKRILRVWKKRGALMMDKGEG